MARPKYMDNKEGIIAFREAERVYHLEYRNRNRDRITEYNRTYQRDLRAKLRQAKAIFNRLQLNEA